MATETDIGISKGKWYVAPAAPTLVVRDEPRRVIASVESTDPEAEAIARAIAKVPAMIELIEKLGFIAEHSGEWFDSYSDGDVLLAPKMEYAGSGMSLTAGDLRKAEAILQEIRGDVGPERPIGVG